MLKRHITSIALFMMSLLSFVGCTTIAPQPPQVAPEAAKWKTWVLAASDELRPAAPPDEAATQAEITELKALVEQRDTVAQAIVTYWDAGSPAYRWVQLADKRQTNLPAGPPHGRTMSLITVAMYDALIAAWDAKYTYNRPRPNVFDGTLTTLVTPPNSPAYPSEHAVVAGAASTVMAYLWPEEAEQYKAMAEEAARSRLLAGVHYPSDVEVGLALGRAVGERIVERAKNDGADAVWDGVMPEGPSHFTWRGDGPAVPMAGTWQTWLLTSNDQLRPPSPPAYDSPERAAEIMAIKTFTRTFASNASAFFWQSHPGIKAYWFDNAHRLLFENKLDENPPFAALVYATVSVAMHDAFVACFDAKYTYWTIRPSQLDPDVVTPFPHPNHPSYPAAHGCNSGAGSTVLAGFFPADGEAMIAAGQEATESRFWAGIHYESDNVAGWEIGQAAGQMAVEHANVMMQP
jgi:membrane-associated phospholipid phosphatase